LQTEAQKLVVVRDQFALKGLSDDALRQIRPVYGQAISQLLDQLKNLPEGSLERELWLRTQLNTLVAQAQAVRDRIMQVLPPSQLQAWDQGLKNAEDYLVAGGIQPGQPAATTTLSGVTTGGQQVSVTGNLPGFNITGATEKGFLSPSITRQQIAASLDAKGFETLLQGSAGEAGRNYSLSAVVERIDLAGDVSRQLRQGFLLGESNDEIARRISYAFGSLGGRNGGRTWAMTQAVVRTSMAEASQSAHDAFYKANEDLLPGTKSGYRWWWDASNDTRLCELCAPLDGVKYKERDDVKGWPRHFSCRCKILPITATMELLEEEDGPASGSFLERLPVEYEPTEYYKNGKPKPLKPKPAPKDYTGNNAYKRPMRIDGKMYWVRRKDMGKGETLAGDMLQRMNDENRSAILGTKHMRHPITGKQERPVKVWNDLIKQEKYARDPQSLVRKLLGDPLPPGSTPPRPTRGPKPVPPAPKATPKPKAAPVPKAAPGLSERVLPAGPQTSLVFAKQGGTGKMFEDAWAQLETVDGEVGENAKKARAFMEKQHIVVNLGLKEKLTNPERLAGNEALLKSQQKAVDVLQVQRDDLLGNKLAGPLAGAKQLNDKLRAGDTSTLKNVMGSLSGCTGYTTQSSGVVNTYMLPTSIPINAKTIKKTVADAEDALKQMNAYIDFYKPGNYRPGIEPPKRPWIASGREQGDVEGWLSTTIHEIGHQVHFRGAAGRTLGNSWKKLGGETRVSGYSHQNEMEQFAEAWVQFILNPKGLKASHPRLYAWVADALEEALK
jgi:hypothetical protein